MPRRAAPPVILAALALAASCGSVPERPATAVAAPAEPLAPSPRLLVGHVIAVDPERGFAFVDLAADAPRDALAEGATLFARRPDLVPAATLRTSRMLRGRTLGTTIAAGVPRPGDEVVWSPPESGD